MVGWGGLALLAGIALGYGTASGVLTLPGGALALCALIASLLVWRLSRSTTRAVAALCVLSTGMAWGTGAAPTLTANDASFYAGRAVTLWGTVSAEPDVRDSATFAVVQATRLVARGLAREVRGLVHVRYSGTPPVAYGDVLQLSGRLESVSALPASGYRTYLRARGIGGMIAYPRLIIVSRGGGSSVEAAVLRLRTTIERTIRAMLPQPEANLLAALLLGGHSAALGSLTPSFVNAGMIHIVATSGLKVALVVGLIYRLSVAWWGWRWALLPTLPAAAAYVALTGATPAGTRAGLMWLMVLLAERLGRRSHALTSLALTAAAMALFTPSLVTDLGFQMSVLGTAGVAGLSRPLEARLRLLPVGLREGLAVTLAAQLGTVPVVAGAFNQLSLIAPLANALCLPLMAVAMAAGAAGALLACAVPALAHVAGYAAYAVLWVMVGVVRLLGAVPAASPATPAFTLAAACAYYVVLLVLVWLFLPGAPRPDFVARHLAGAALSPPRPLPALPLSFTLALGGGSLLLAVGWQAPPGGLYRVSLLPTGHGQTVVLQTPRGQVVVIDGSDGAAAFQQAIGTVLPFWRRTVTLVLLSATDRAHAGGLLGLTDTYHVDTAGDGGSSYPTASYALWRAELRRSGARHLMLRRGDRLQLDGGAAIDVLAPLDRTAGSAAVPAAYRLWIGQVSLLLVNKTGLGLVAQTWSNDPSPTGNRVAGDTVVVLPALPQQGNAAWRLLAATNPAVAVLPAAWDAAALGDQTGPLAVPAGTARTWQGQRDSRLDLFTDGRRFSLAAVP